MTAPARELSPAELEIKELSRLAKSEPYRRDIRLAAPIHARISELRESLKQNGATR